MNQTNKNDWTVVYLTDTGREVTHWTSETRREARACVLNLKRCNPRLKIKIIKQPRLAF